MQRFLCYLLYKTYQKRAWFGSPFLVSAGTSQPRLRRRWHESLRPPPWNTFPVCLHEHTTNLEATSLIFSTPTVAVKIAQTGGALDGAQAEAVQSIKTAWPRGIEFLQF